MQWSLVEIDGWIGGVALVCGEWVLARPCDDGARGGEFLDGDDLGDAGDEIGELDTLGHVTLGISIELGTKLGIVVHPDVVTIEILRLKRESETKQLVENGALLGAHVDDCHDQSFLIVMAVLKIVLMMVGIIELLSKYKALGQLIMLENGMRTI